MKVDLLVVGKSTDKWLDDYETAYLKKINHLVSLNLKMIKGPSLPRDRADAKIRDEEKKLFQLINSRDYVVLFDEKGKSLDSIRFSKELTQPLESGRKVLLIIGGAFGVGELIKQRADLKVSLSPMTMNHLVARTVVLEQVYRAFTIWKKIPYHNV